jgi:uncharacterized protein
MGSRQVGTVAALFRYPVKSMLGETMTELMVGSGGVIGDRAWALREIFNGRIVSAKKLPQTFQFRAAYPPDSSSPAITLPDGRTVAADAPDTSEVLSATLGRKVSLERAQADQVPRASFDPQTLFGDMPAERMLEIIMKYQEVDVGPDNWALPKGSFFDGAPLHILASGTLTHLTHLAGASRFDPRRFRPNILVETGSEAGRFIEDEWLNHAMQIGRETEIAVTVPVVRCVMTTHSQEDLPRDLALLRTVAKQHEALVGAYANVKVPGRIRIGDPVMLAD